MGKPQQFKTNNGLEYTSTAFQWFCEANQIYHTTGIPYNPQGQAIVERAHATLKMQLKNLKGGDEVLPPDSQIHKALYTLNLLNCPEQGLTPAERHWQPQEPTVSPLVLWKDVLTDKWHGPSPVLMWG
jgi:transposase InsO family protein